MSPNGARGFSDVTERGRGFGDVVSPKGVTEPECAGREGRLRALGRLTE
jgi:hypothetical protein